MDRIKSRLFKLSLAVSLPLAIITSVSTLVWKPQALLAQKIPERWEPKEFKVPGNIGAPGRRQQGGTRRGAGICQTKKPLMALVPLNSYGVTVAAYPQFLFYMPEIEPGSPPQQVEFVLDDNNDNSLYKATFKTTGKSGIITISPPQDAGLPPLQVNKIYHWSFSIICNPEDRSADIYVDGRIQRIQPKAKLRDQLERATLKDKAKLYVQAGIWFDAVKTLAELHRSNPKDSAAAADWERLLSSVGLQEIAEESWVPGAIRPTRQLPNSEP